MASASVEACQDICVQSNAFPSATLLERWLFHYEPVAPEVNLQRRRTQLARLDPPALYKRAVRFYRCAFMYELRAAPAISALSLTAIDSTTQD